MNTWRRRMPTIITCLVAASAAAQPVRDAHEQPAKIVIEAPLPEAFSIDSAVVPYRTENLRVAPLFGPAALSLSPRVGHVHVSVDDAPWVWAHTSEGPVIVAGLSPGPHKVRFQLVNANHQRLDEGAVQFTVPEAQVTVSVVTHIEPQARIIIDSPLPEPLSRGVVFIRYRTAAAAGSAPIGHIHVTVDETPWHWVDSSGNPVIVQGLSPGQHKILIELANGNDQVIDKRTVEVTIPAPKSRS